LVRLNLDEYQIDALPVLAGKSWVTVGNFDGVHLGHQALIKRLVEGAQETDQKSVLINFWPHPKVVLDKVTGPFYLSTFDEKQALLGQLSIDEVITLAFNEMLYEMSAEAFLTVLVEKLGVTHLIVGPDFSIGKERQGNLANLQCTFRRLGIKVILFDPLEVDGEVISSGTIRQSLLTGDVITAARLLGRFYSVEGRVIQGKGQGLKSGFPTANLQFEPMKILPRHGVYAGWAWVRGVRHPAVTNVGVRPTFESSGKPSVETLLLDFDDNIYGEHLKVDFVSRLRDEIKFDGVVSLLTQINQDKKEARRILEDGEKS
jgi:riboflavin kinase/FMN adenylyltransferase